MNQKLLGQVWERKSLVVCMRLREDVSNQERFISEVMKEYQAHHLEAVAFNEELQQLRLYFIQEENHKKPKNFVLQVSTKKHPDLDEFLNTQGDVDSKALLAKVVLPEATLLFFSEFARKH